MLITSYNSAALGDVLIAMVAPSNRTDQAESRGDITVITQPDGTLVGVNFLAISKILDVTEWSAGQIQLDVKQVAQLNQALQVQGFKVSLEADLTPKFVVGYVESATKHPDSDHLQVTTTRIGNDQTVQIVSGSPNMQAGLKVVVALVGAMMPSGLVIWPGALRGVASDGMIVSGRELRLPNAPQAKGALVLPDDFAPVGTAFDVNSNAAQHLFD
ncbi:hypothetical protein IV73_GL000696 [Weissella kandleri]|uniref:tRNA-binding domain-containing protein n=1 Tax=Weissella kandleri TaxID=1616 RepID=A0A0R2JCB0_9LACO|nr:DUF4479 domain-containing protein [Weissella kandleri]KRN74942.1 hypothetical protein IV73_GL000696 [Weissella kandleri]